MSYLPNLLVFYPIFRFFVHVLFSFTVLLAIAIVFSIDRYFTYMQTNENILQNNVWATDVDDHEINIVMINRMRMRK